MKAIRIVVLGGLCALMLAPAILAPAQARTKKHAAAPAKAKPAATAAAQPLGTSGAWSAYAAQDQSGRVCYLVGTPEKSEPAVAGRKPPLAMVTHRRDEKIANVVSFAEGYTLKDGSAVVLDIGGGKFELFTKGDGAWAPTADLDKAIVAALSKGKQAIVKGTPAKGPATTDSYALAGFAKGLALIDKACGVKR